MRFRRRALVCLTAVCCLTLACLPGCGKSKGTVKGKVSFRNIPLTKGTIAFVDAKGSTTSGTIKADGTYVVGNIPVGDVTITIQTPKPMMGGVAIEGKRPPGMSMPKEMIPPGHQDESSVRVVPAPEKYNKVETSPLKFTVQSGNQEHNVELSP
ncbi:MAG TPA: hypothetical protein VH643_03580 [Gemmataceae bacterium]|jgi:hypothetical protein